MLLYHDLRLSIIKVFDNIIALFDNLDDLTLGLLWEW